MKLICTRHALTAITFISWIYISILPAFAIENDSIGKVIALRGKAVAISEKSESRRLALKDPVFLNDTIKTENGRLQMMFKDNTLVTLGRNSQMQITKYLWEAGNSSSAMETKVEEGSFRIMGGAITRIAPQNFKTDAPSGTIGIRGSMYAGRVEGQNLFVLFQGGKGIYVENEAGMVDITIPGFSTLVKSGSTPPQEPRKVEPEQLQELEIQLAQAPDDEPAAPVETENGEPAGGIGEALDAEETIADGDPLEILSQEDEATVSQNSDMEILTEVESIVSDATVGYAQDQVEGAMTPEGTEQTLQFMLANLGVTDLTLSTTRPSSGVWYYKGEMTDTLGQVDQSHGMKFIVNWSNSRLIGFEDDSGAFSMGFGFGEITTDGEIFNMKVLGSDAHGGVMALTGSQTFGHFYGAGQEGLGLAMEGYDYNIQDQTQSEFWSDLVAAKLETTTGSAPSAAETWNGFFIGVSEDMSDPNTGRRVFHNTTGSDFELNIDKTAGTFSGDWSGPDFNPSGYAIDVMSVGGGTNDSVYIDDKTLAAEINTADISPVAAGLKTYGNFMVTANEPMLSSYTTWGYWEVAYEESPSPGDDYHLHVPGSRWIAGVQGSLPINFVGVYQGGARGVMFDTSTQMQDLTGGTATINVDFNGVSTPVWGNISFNEVNLPVTTSSAADLAAAGFNATISGATSSSVNGAFFGPTIPGGSGSAPAAVGGNFSAEMPGGVQYHGIFAGDLQP